MSAAEKLVTTIDFGAVHYVRHDQLQPSPLNPRKHARTDAQIAELAASIAGKGVLQNLVVRDVDGKGKLFEIAAGEGRWRAVAKLIEDGLAKGDYRMPVAVRELTDTDMIEIGLIENLQRNDLHPLDEARAFRDYVDGHKGAKAQAKATKTIAAKIGKSERYVQKRIKLARDLLPEWQQQLEAGALQLQTAMALSSMPKHAQETELDECSDFKDGEERTPVTDRVAQLTPHTLVEMHDWRRMKSALFDPALYTGDVEDVGGEPHAVDAKAFDKLQKAAAAALTKEFRAKAKAGDIAFFEELQNFRASDYEQVGDPPDPAGGVVLVHGYDDIYELYRGLTKTEDAAKRDEKRKAAAAAEARRAKRQKEQLAKPPKEREVDLRVRKVRDVVAKNQDVAIALNLYDLLAPSYGKDTLPRWYDRYSSDGSAAVRAALGNDAPKSGSKLLAWLLLQKSAVLKAAAIASMADADIADSDIIDNPSPIEKVIFARCGVDGGVPIVEAAKKPKAAKRTASKSKPSKKKGKGK